MELPQTSLFGIVISWLSGVRRSVDIIPTDFTFPVCPFMITISPMSIGLIAATI